MNHGLVIVAYYGYWPDWIDEYLECAQGRGFDWLIHNDLADFNTRVERELGVMSSVTEGSAKIHDYRPAFGKLFADEMAGYDWWAHTDIDCVYGRLDHFYSPVHAAGYDVLSDHGYYLCGPWTMYRNIQEINDLFMSHPSWKAILENPSVCGWVETEFTELMQKQFRVRYRQLHEYLDPDMLRVTGDELWHGDREIPFFHFRRKKQWPL